MNIHTVTSLNVEELRAQRLSWVEISARVREQSQVSALVAMRTAHGWSQAQAADAWNALWPDDEKTGKNVSYWESWPGSGGYAPSLPVLVRLAELYQVAVSDLLDGVGDFRRLDEQHPRTDLLEPGENGRVADEYAQADGVGSGDEVVVASGS